MIARVLSIGAASFYLFMVIGSALGELGPINLEGLLVGLFGVLLMISALIAYHRDRLGGRLLTIAGLCFAVFVYTSAGTNKLPAALLLSLPFVLAGIMFMVADRCNRRPS